MKQKMNFFQRIKRAVFNIEKYQEFAQEKTIVAVKYFVKLILLLSVIITLGAVYKFGAMADFFVDTFKTDFPDFTFSNNILNANEVISVARENKNMKLAVIVDTEIPSDDSKVNEYITEMSKYENAVIFLKDKMILQLDGLSGQATYKYEQLNAQGLGEITKQSIEDTLNNINMGTIYIAFFISIIVYMFVIYLISTFMETIFIAILGYLTAKIVKVNLKASQAYSMAVYAITLSVLLNAVYVVLRLITGFNIQYFSIMYTTIPYIYIVTAILMIRSELIKQQIEIGKIEKVQKIVKQELEDEKENDEDNKEKEKKKEKKEEDNGGEQPEGSEA